MKIVFDEIAGKTKRYAIKDVSWFPQELGTFSAKDSCWVSVCRLNPETVMLKGEFNGYLHGQCGRCGVDVREGMTNRFEYLVTARKENYSDAHEIECSDDDVNTLYLLEPEIDIDKTLREQAYLESPVRMLCKKSCRGICQGCGAQLNSETCRCSADYSDSPFAVLGKINKK